MSRTKSERDILNERSYQCISLKIYCCFLWLTRSMFDCLSITFDFYSIAFDCYSITFDCYSIAFNLWKYCIRHFFFLLLLLFSLNKKKTRLFSALEKHRIWLAVSKALFWMFERSENEAGFARSREKKELKTSFFMLHTILYNFFLFTQKFVSQKI